MSKFSGSKFSGNHSTATDAAIKPIKAAEKELAVTKIVLGPIVSINSNGRGARHIKFKDVPAGVEVTVKGNSYTQLFWVYCLEKNRQVVATAMKIAFEN